MSERLVFGDPESIKKVREGQTAAEKIAQAKEVMEDNGLKLFKVSYQGTLCVIAKSEREAEIHVERFLESGDLEATAESVDAMEIADVKRLPSDWTHCHPFLADSAHEHDTALSVNCRDLFE